MQRHTKVRVFIEEQNLNLRMENWIQKSLKYNLSYKYRINNTCVILVCQNLI